MPANFVFHFFFSLPFLFTGFAVRFSFFRCTRDFPKISLMRVCFDGLCFASRRAAAVDEETQTVSDVHDTGGGGCGGVCAIGQTNHIYDSTSGNNTNSSTTSERNPVTESKDTTDSSHKNHKHHCTGSSTARSKLLSLLSLNNIDKKIFFLRAKMDSNDASRNHTANSNTYDIDLVNRNHSNSVVSVYFPFYLLLLLTSTFFLLISLVFSALFYRPITIIIQRKWIRHQQP